MRYEAVLGFNSKQWWVYDNKNDTYIDPPQDILNNLREYGDIEGQELELNRISNSIPAPDWLFDKEYIYSDIEI